MTFSALAFLGVQLDYPVNGVVSVFARFLVETFLFDHEVLSDMGKIQALVERRGCPNFTGFDAFTMGGVRSIKSGVCRFSKKRAISRRKVIEVGQPVARLPPHRSRRAELGFIARIFLLT